MVPVGLHSNVVPFFSNLFWQYYWSLALDPSEKSEVNDRARVSLLPRAEPGHSCSAYPSFHYRLGPGRWLSPRRGVNTHYLRIVEHSSHNLGFFDARLLRPATETNKFLLSVGTVKFDRRLPGSWPGFGLSVRFLWRLLLNKKLVMRCSFVGKALGLDLFMYCMQWIQQQGVSRYKIWWQCLMLEKEKKCHTKKKYQKFMFKIAGFGRIGNLLVMNSLNYT